MQTFSIQIQADGDKAVFSLRGVLDENSDFQQLKFGAYKNIILDLKALERINSRGLRKWITWLSGADQAKKFAITNCPKVMVVQANMVKGVIPRWMKVVSVELPFYCEKCQIPFSAPFTLPDSRKAPSEVTSRAPCPTCRQDAEVDADTESYFRFSEFQE